MQYNVQDITLLNVIHIPKIWHMQYNVQNSWDLYSIGCGTRNALTGNLGWNVQKPNAKITKGDQEGMADKLWISMTIYAIPSCAGAKPECTTATSPKLLQHIVTALTLSNFSCRYRIGGNFCEGFNLANWRIPNAIAKFTIRQNYCTESEYASRERVTSSNHVRTFIATIQDLWG